MRHLPPGGQKLTMSKPSVQSQAGFSLRPKYFVFGAIFLMMAYVLNHNERFLWDSHDPAWEHYATFKWWLLPHGVTAACALLLGPMQFSDRLRKRFTKLHRVVGRIYVGGAVIGAPIGAYIQYRFDEHLGMTRSFQLPRLSRLYPLPIFFSPWGGPRGGGGGATTTWPYWKCSCGCTSRWHYCLGISQSIGRTSFPRARLR